MSIVFCFSGQLDMAVYAIFAGAVFDFADGFLARKLKLESETGKQLDSLADLITFGVAPGFLMFFMILIGIEQPNLIEHFNRKSAHVNYENYYIFNQLIHWVQAFYFDFQNNYNASIKWLPFFAFLIPFFSLFRLAAFNVDKKQTKNFRGIPTPLSALIVCFFPLYFQKNMMEWNHQNEFVQLIFDCYTLSGICFILSILLVSNLPLMSMKLDGTNKKENILRIIVILSGLITIPLWGVLAIPIILTLYFIVSTYHHYTKI